MTLDISALPILKYADLCQRLSINPELHEWRSLVGLDSNVFDHLIKAAFSQYAESIQLAPASESHHHCGPGGLLTHTYEVITLALKMRSGIKLPIGASISEIEHKQHLWTYGVFAGCLLHDIGKLLTSIRIQLNLENGTQRWWTPHDKALTAFTDAKSYSIKFVKVQYHMHTYIGPTLFDILPRMARAWLANEAELMKQICAHLRGDRYESGIIGDLAERADMESTRANLQLPMPSKRFSRALPLIDRYLGFIRDWVADGSIRMNVNGGMGWCDQEGHIYFVCRSLAEKIISKCDELGINDTPREVVRIYDILQEHGYALPTSDGKAVWTITAVGSDFRHAFTCLKFEARRLTVPTRPIKPFSGEILIGKIPPPVKPAEVAPATENENIAASGAENKQAAQSADEAVGTDKISEDAENKTSSAENSNAASGRSEAVGTEAEKETQETAIEPETMAEEAAPAADEKDNPPPKPSLVFAAANKRRQPPEPEAERKAEGKKPPEAAPAAEKKILEAASNEAEPEVVETASDTVNEVSEVVTKPTEEQLELEVMDSVGQAPTTEAKLFSEQKDVEAPQGKAEGSDVISSVVDRSRDGHAVYQGLDSSDPQIASKFVNWLRTNLIEKTIIINDVKAVVHIVPEGVFILAPSVFKMFCTKHGLPEDAHAKISKKFDRKSYHIKADKGLNIHAYWVVGKSRHSKIQGRLIPFSVIYGDDYPIPKPNTFIYKTIPQST
ncbi:MobH family relaxase [Marinagarivorans cellulosilyticus]|uniref:Relaxase n=1 Tax=Marinagarivorans cellulosilyticus TaxID=2721545 RepID=A0AAN2BK95_9GAMM|nr:MobH family relaxase [Marinagarivorans cellulosilyticus]BCD97771.1 hypothetical protein MARGE09_P1972 [Marinagarivorans cellulosilyticus]